MAVKKERSKRTPQKAEVRASKTQPAEKQIKVRLVRSLIGRPRRQREVVKGLGLRKVNSEVIRRDCPEIWGMIKRIPHLLEVEVLEKK